MKKVFLSLVGAGPGDVELITLKAINILKKADVILYDALANEALLEYACPNAVKRFVGKRYGCHALSQSEINRLIIEYAFSHGHVVRLKGGDPFVFGRAQEEIEAARNAGIEVDVIPGISSAIAVPASQMIPLTCRGINESFWVYYGHHAGWRNFQRHSFGGAVFCHGYYINGHEQARSHNGYFCSAWQKRNACRHIQDGTTDKEKMVIGKVSDIAFKAQYAGLGNPAIIMVGEVVNLHPSQLAQKVSMNTNNYINVFADKK